MTTTTSRIYRPPKRSDYEDLAKYLAAVLADTNLTTVQKLMKYDEYSDATDPPDALTSKYLIEKGDYYYRFMSNLYCDPYTQADLYYLVRYYHQEDSFRKKKALEGVSIPYYYHPYVMMTTVRMIMTETMRMMAGGSVLVVPPDAPELQSGSLARVPNADEGRAGFVRMLSNASLAYSISSEMFPLEESCVPFPYRIVVFVLWSTAKHYSCLVHYVQDAHHSRNDDDIRYSVSRVPRKSSSTSRRIRLYHYDSTTNQVNFANAKVIAGALQNYHLLSTHLPVEVVQMGAYFQSGGKVTGSSPFGRAVAEKKATATAPGELVIGAQIQGSCGSWSMAYVHEIWKRSLFSNCNPLPYSALIRMNEVCSTELLKITQIGMMRAGAWYYSLLSSQVGDRYSAIAQRLIDSFVFSGVELKDRLKEVVGSATTERVPDISGGDVALAEWRAGRLVRFLVRLYARPGVDLKSDPAAYGALSFIPDDTAASFHPDFVRLYMTLDVANPPDIVVSTTPGHLAHAWEQNGMIEMTNARRGGPRSMGMTDMNRPKLYAYLHLPDENDRNPYPVLLLGRPRYHTAVTGERIFQAMGEIVLFTSSRDERFIREAAWTFVTSCDQTVFSISSPEQPPGVVSNPMDEIVHHDVDASFGRYYVLEILRLVLRSDLDILGSDDRFGEAILGAALMGHGNIQRKLKREAYARVMYWLSEAAPSEPIEPRDQAPPLAPPPPSVGKPDIYGNPVTWRYSDLASQPDTSAALGKAVQAYEPYHKIFGEPESTKESWSGLARRTWSGYYTCDTLQTAIERGVRQANYLARSDHAWRASKIPTRVPLLTRGILLPDQRAAIKEFRTSVIVACPSAMVLGQSQKGQAAEALRKKDPDGSPCVFYEWTRLKQGTETLATGCLLPTAGKVVVYPETRNQMLASDLGEIVARTRGSPAYRDGIIQYPFLIHGSRIGPVNCPVVVVGLWDIVAILLQDSTGQAEMVGNEIEGPSPMQISSLGEDSVARLALQEDLATAPSNIDPSVRITQHDPYVHFLCKRFDPNDINKPWELVDRINAELAQTRLALKGKTVSDVISDGRVRPLLEYTISDVAILATRLLFRKVMNLDAVKQK